MESERGEVFLTDGDELGDGELLAELVGAAGGARPLRVHLLPAHQRPDPTAHPGRPPRPSTTAPFPAAGPGELDEGTAAAGRLCFLLAEVRLRLSRGD